MKLIVIGTILDTRGLKGELKVFSQTHFASKRYQKGNKLLLQKEEDILEVTVKDYKPSGQIDFVSFEEYPSIDEAQKLKGYKICINKEELDLGKDEFLFSDLVDLKVITDDGKCLGKVTKVEEFPAQVTLRCQTEEKKNFFVPFIKSFIKEVNLEKGEIIIHYMEGLL